jgi:hypothetical protein
MRQKCLYGKLFYRVSQWYFCSEGVGVGGLTCREEGFDRLVQNITNANEVNIDEFEIGQDLPQKCTESTKVRQYKLKKFL